MKIGALSMGEAWDSNLYSNLQFICALNNFRVQLSHAISLDKRVNLKLAGVGLGVFNNSSEIVGNALKQALEEFSETRGQVRVQFQIFQNFKGPLDSVACEAARAAGL